MHVETRPTPTQQKENPFHAATKGAAGSGIPQFLAFMLLLAAVAGIMIGLLSQRRKTAAAQNQKADASAITDTSFADCGVWQVVKIVTNYPSGTVMAEVEPCAGNPTTRGHSRRHDSYVYADGRVTNGSLVRVFAPIRPPAFAVPEKPAK